MKTNSYHYNTAVKESKQRVSVSLDEVKKDIESGQDIEVYPPKGAKFCYDIDISETYNSECAEKLLEQLGIEKTEKTMDVAESYIYNTKGQDRDIATIRKYEEMAQNGWTPIADITEEDDGKLALLTGTVSHDFLTVKKDNEKVKLVKTDTAHGYQRPQQRTKYIPCHDEMFIKIIK